jgi:hypothetical protein
MSVIHNHPRARSRGWPFANFFTNPNPSTQITPLPQIPPPPRTIYPTLPSCPPVRLLQHRIETQRTCSPSLVHQYDSPCIVLRALCVFFKLFKQNSLNSTRVCDSTGVLKSPDLISRCKSANGSFACGTYLQPLRRFLRLLGFPVTNRDAYLCVKVVSTFPQATDRNTPVINYSYEFVFRNIRGIT